MSQHRAVAATSPRALGSETALLGTAILYPGAAERVLTDLQPGDFYDPRHSAVLATIGDMIDQNTPPETPLVLAALWRQHGVRPPTGTSWALILADLLCAATVPAAAPHHRKALLEARLRREAIDYATRLTHTATEGDLPQMSELLTTSITTLATTLARLSDHTPTPAPTALRTAA